MLLGHPKLHVTLTQDWIIHRRDDGSTKIYSPNTVHLGTSNTDLDHNTVKSIAIDGLSWVR